MEGFRELDDAFRLPPLPAELLQAYPPDQDALFALIRPQVTDEMLRVVAACDYGSDFDAHLAGLKKIRAGIDLDVPIGWEPNEVLCLFRWSEWGRRETAFSKPIEFHLARAFCCCALLRVPDHVENRSLYDNDSLAPLIDSCLVLGEPYRRRLIRQVLWSLQKIDPLDDEYLFHAFGLAFLMASNAGDHERFLPTLGDWFVETHAQVMRWRQTEGLDWVETFVEIPYASTQPIKWVGMMRNLKSRIASESPLGRFLA